MRFSKMHGLGNDYVYVNGFEEKIADPVNTAIKVSDRHFGIGGDGMIIILPSTVADFRMQMFNADGSEGKMCGNGIRCVGKFVYDNGLTQKTEITVETLAGIRKLVLFPDSSNKIEKVKVWMGLPRFPDQEAIADLPSKEFPVKVEAKGKSFELHSVSMGNPHTITLVDAVDTFDVEGFGSVIQKNPMFPESVNVEFVELVSRNAIKMRVYERGSGETLACGTGSCASAAVMMRLGKIEKKAEVRLLGGSLFIEWQEDGIYMTGPATHVFDGEIVV